MLNKIKNAIMYCLGYRQVKVGAYYIDPTNHHNWVEHEYTVSLHLLDGRWLTTLSSDGQGGSVDEETTWHWNLPRPPKSLAWDGKVWHLGDDDAWQLDRIKRG